MNQQCAKDNTTQFTRSDVNRDENNTTICEWLTFKTKSIVSRMGRQNTEKLGGMRPGADEDS